MPRFLWGKCEQGYPYFTRYLGLFSGVCGAWQRGVPAR